MPDTDYTVLIVHMRNLVLFLSLFKLLSRRVV